MGCGNIDLNKLHVGSHLFELDFWVNQKNILIKRG